KSMPLPQTFKAMVVSETADQKFIREIRQKELSDLPAGELLIEVKYSSLNYKDALSASGNKGVTRKYPHTPGIDAAGVVATSSALMLSPPPERPTRRIFLRSSAPERSFRGTKRTILRADRCKKAAGPASSMR